MAVRQFKIEVEQLKKQKHAVLEQHHAVEDKLKIIDSKNEEMRLEIQKRDSKVVLLNDSVREANKLLEEFKAKLLSLSLHERELENKNVALSNERATFKSLADSNEGSTRQLILVRQQLDHLEIELAQVRKEKQVVESELIAIRSKPRTIILPDPRFS